MSSNRFRIGAWLAIGAASMACAAGSLAAAPAAGSASPIGKRAVWIWYLSRSAGGSVNAIAAQAHATGVDAVFVKSSDGATAWSQFNAALVRALHAAGLRVCAWQYVYGVDPLGEAAQGAHAVADGADCLIIDAETEYQGRYASAQVYLHALRASVGSSYPLALASLPYVDYHPAFPYSVFLGPGGAQFDMPQMYWRDIGASVPDVFHHTYLYNRIYRRPIVPVGQAYGAPAPWEVSAFRGSTVRYRAPGISWWDFAWATASALWPSLGGPFGPVPVVPALGYPDLTVGSKGDAVLWLQEHLARVYAGQRLTGLFGAQTLANLDAFQALHGLPASGRTDAATWHALFRLAPVAPSWGAGAASTARLATTSARTPRRAVPASASLRALHDEIPEVGSSAAQPPVVDPGQ